MSRTSPRATASARRSGPIPAPALSLFDFPEPAERETVRALVAVALEDDKRQMSALAIAETQADLLVLQEVDNLGVLQPFFANYVHRISDCRYGHFRLIDGNDPRGIDVAFAARRDLFDHKKQVVARSHQEKTFGRLGVFTQDLIPFGITPDDLVFNRDCLEVTLDFGTTELVLYICHFKAIAEHGDGRSHTRPIRQAEARAVKQIVKERFGDDWRDANWIIAGDLNDFVERIVPGGGAEPAEPGGLDPLFEDFAVNPVAALPARERWTLFPAVAAERPRRRCAARPARLYPAVTGACRRATPSRGRAAPARSALPRAPRSGRSRPLDRPPLHPCRPLPAGRLGPAEGERPLSARHRDRSPETRRRSAGRSENSGLTGQRRPHAPRADRVVTK